MAALETLGVAAEGRGSGTKLQVSTTRALPDQSALNPQAAEKYAASVGLKISAQASRSGKD
jgi:hypothetical protein